jgi:acyl-CoA dehydrogenase
VALDFTLPPDLNELVDRVRTYVEEDVLPAEPDVTDPTDLLSSWHVVERLRDRARERGLYTPHLPEEWGGLGIGTLGMALISQECGVSALASLGLNAMAPDEGNMHTLLIAGNEEQL